MPPSDGKYHKNTPKSTKMARDGFGVTGEIARVYVVARTGIEPVLPT